MSKSILVTAKDGNIRKLANEIRLVADQLERWAHESETGGWSTHQIKPQRELATHLYSVLGKMGI